MDGAWILSFSEYSLATRLSRRRRIKSPLAMRRRLLTVRLGRMVISGSRPSTLRSSVTRAMPARLASPVFSDLDFLPLDKDSAAEFQPAVDGIDHLAAASAHQSRDPQDLAPPQSKADVLHHVAIGNDRVGDRQALNTKHLLWRKYSESRVG